MDKLDILKDIGEKVRKKRSDLGISQTELAHRIDKDQQSIHRLESGNINPSYIYLLEVAEGLGVSLSELLTIVI
ncbi:MAG: transcriptional regulator [Flavobacteriales bacterium]|nr:MAG: transcriptional regulator [Flavobacteriales bacterium]